MKVKDIYDFLNEYAPFSVQDKYDNSGFLVGDINAKVKGICLCLDITMDVIKRRRLIEQTLSFLIIR